MESRPAFDPPAIPYESPPDSISYMASLANPSRPEDSMDLSTHTVDVLNSSPGYNSGVRGVALALPPNLEVPISLSRPKPPSPQAWGHEAQTCSEADPSDPRQLSPRQQCLPPRQPRPRYEALEEWWLCDAEQQPDPTLGTQTGRRQAGDQLR